MDDLVKIEDVNNEEYRFVSYKKMCLSINMEKLTDLIALHGKDYITTFIGEHIIDNLDNN